MAVITVTRGLGSGGDEIAFQVAERLGIPFLDREITHSVAKEAGISEESLRDVERGPSLVDRMLDYLARYPAEDGIHWPYDPGIRSFDTADRSRKLIEQFIRQIASRGPSVILGHGATAVLADHPQVLRCLFSASPTIRVERVMEHEGISKTKAEQRIAETDKTWRSFLKTYYDVDWISARHYDLVINTGRISIDTSVDMVIAAAQAIDAKAVVAAS